MNAPAGNDSERERRAALRALEILDTEPEESFDRLTRLARATLDAPVAFLALVDGERCWFKSIVGCSARERPRVSAARDHRRVRRSADQRRVPDLGE